MSSTDTNRHGVRVQTATAHAIEVERASAALAAFTAQVLGLVARGSYRGKLVVNIGPKGVTGELTLSTGEDQGYDFGV